MSDHGTPVYAGGEREFDEPRMSALAVVGLVCSLICLIPALPLIGAALGGAALLKINSSGGRLAGVGMALVAICVGAVLTLGQAGLGYFGWQGYKGVKQYLGPLTKEVGQAVAEIGGGEFDKARSHFSPEVAAKVSDEEFAQFRAGLEANFGVYESSVGSLSEAISIVRSAPGLGGNQKVQIGGGGSPRPAMPALLKFSKGPVFVFAQLDQSKMKGKAGAPVTLVIEDIIVFLPGRRAMTLRHEGPGKQAALDFGMQPVYGDEAAPKNRAPAAEAGSAAPSGSPAQEQR